MKAYKIFVGGFQIGTEELTAEEVKKMNNGAFVVVEIVKRTAKTVTFVLQPDNEKYKKTLRRRILDYGAGETIEAEPTIFIEA